MQSNAIQAFVPPLNEYSSPSPPKAILSLFHSKALDRVAIMRLKSPLLKRLTTAHNCSQMIESLYVWSCCVSPGSTSLAAAAAAAGWMSDSIGSDV